MQPTGITDDGTTYYIENGKTYMGPKVKDLDGIPSNERSNNYGLWLEEMDTHQQGYRMGIPIIDSIMIHKTLINYSLITQIINRQKNKVM